MEVGYVAVDGPALSQRSNSGPAEPSSWGNYAMDAEELALKSPRSNSGLGEQCDAVQARSYLLTDEFQQKVSIQDLAELALGRLSRTPKATAGGNNPKCQLNQVVHKIVHRPPRFGDVLYITKPEANGLDYRSTVRLTPDVAQKVGPFASKVLEGLPSRSEKEAEHAAALAMLQWLSSAEPLEGPVTFDIDAPCPSVYRTKPCREGSNCRFSDCAFDHNVWRPPICRDGLACSRKPATCVFLHPWQWYQTFAARIRESKAHEGEEEGKPGAWEGNPCPHGCRCWFSDCDYDHGSQRTQACWHGIQCARTPETCNFSHPRAWYQKDRGARWVPKSQKVEGAEADGCKEQEMREQEEEAADEDHRWPSYEAEEEGQEMPKDIVNQCPHGNRCCLSDCEYDHVGFRLRACWHGSQCDRSPEACHFSHPWLWYQWHRGGRRTPTSQIDDADAEGKAQEADEDLHLLQKMRNPCSLGTGCRISDCEFDHPGKRSIDCWKGAKCSRTPSSCIFSHPRSWCQGFVTPSLHAGSSQEHKDISEFADDDDIPAPPGLDELDSLQDLRDSLGPAAAAASPPPPAFDPSLAIFLPDVPPDVDRTTLIELFAPFGRARCYRHPVKSWARVSFEHETIVEDLICARVVTLRDGRMLRLKRFGQPGSKATSKEDDRWKEATYPTDILLRARRIVPRDSSQTLRAMPRSFLDPVLTSSADSATSTRSTTQLEPDVFLEEDKAESEEETVVIIPAVPKRRWGRALERCVVEEGGGLENM